MPIFIVQGDLLDQDVEVIVNAWNRNLIPWWLLLPQGISGAIKRRGGLAPFKELRKFGVLPLGGAAVTGAGRLPYKAIIHVAGIGHLWRSSEASIRRSVRSAILKAQEHGYESVGFPLIGAGTGGGSPDKVEGMIREEIERSGYSGRAVIVRYTGKKRENTMKTIMKLIVGGAILASSSQAETVEDRVAQTLQTSESAAKNPNGAWLATWYFSHNRKEDGLKAIYKVLDGFKPDRKTGQINMGHPFYYYGIIDCYVRYGQLFDEPHKQKMLTIARAIGGYSYNVTPFPSRAATGNLRMIGSMSWYFNTIAFGSDAFPKEYYNADDPTLVNWLKRVTAQIARTGMPEYGSGPYGIYNIFPLLCMRDNAKDAELAKMAGVAYEAFLAQVAPAWLGGHWVVSTGRSYGDVFGQRTASNLNFLWVYYGGYPNGGNYSGLPAAALSYRPPDYLVKIASDRSKPYVALSRFSYDKVDDPYITHLPSDVLQYTYMNKTYGIFSQPTNPGAVLQEQQIYPNGVMWWQPEGGTSFLWATIPGGGSSHTHGSIERGLEFVQHEESWLMVGKPTAADPMHYIACFIPKGYESIIDDAAKDGRIYIAYKSVLIAISLPAPFKWDPDQPLDPRNPKDKNPPEGTGFRFPGDSLALAMETAAPVDVPGATPADKLKNFRANISPKSKISLVNGLATYKTASGHTLSRRVGEMGVVDGVPFDVTKKPFLSNPWMFQPYQQDFNQPAMLTISVDGKTHLYDLHKWTITHKNGPAQPVHVVASSSHGKVSLKWQPGPGQPTEYRIKRATHSGGPYSLVATVKTQQWEDAAANDQAASYYLVTAVNAGEESDPSPEVRFLPGTPQPAARLAAQAGDKKVALKWDAVAGATGYKIMRSTVPGGAYMCVGTADKPEYVDPTVTNNTTFHYVVAATNAAGDSGFSNEDTATPLLTPPAAPTGVASKIVDGKVVLNWKPVPGATHYCIMRSGAHGGMYAIRGMTKTETVWTDNSRGGDGATMEKNCYRILAVNEGGNSLPSEIVDAK